MEVQIRKRGDDPERFWQKVSKSESCWEWNAFRDRAGYGRFEVHGSPRLAHRVSFEREFGPIPDGLEVDHLCHNPPCVRPDHLRLATRSGNSQNMSGARIDSRSGVRGVRQRESGRWQAEAHINKKRVSIGLFDSKEQAHEAVSAWRQRNMPYSLMDQRKD
ncbi:TPA: HNH endonuclease [Shigella flexneri]|nr:HNH endonuclease [Shigella flexneri]